MPGCRSLRQMRCICTGGGGGLPHCYTANFPDTHQGGGKEVRCPIKPVGRSGWKPGNLVSRSSSASDSL